MTRLEKAFAAGLVLCVAMAAWQLPFSRNCAQIREDTLRLHIVANSDSDEDQAVKLAVRDAILESAPDFFGGASSREEAVALAREGLGTVEEIAARSLARNGFDYGARASVTEMYFDQRSYDGLTLPAGRYTALRIELGEAEGKNWWCVVYPSLCLPGASDREALDSYTEEEREIVTGEEKYEYRFKLEEWFQALFSSEASS
jgi:stage II sporulation protein R